MTHSDAPRILVAEADDAIAAALAKVLGRAGYQVLVGSDGEVAAGHLVTGKIDLLLLDPDTLSDDSGVFRKWLRETAAICPVILLSGSATSGWRRDVAQLGALLEKPADPGVLLETVSNLLKEAAPRPKSRVAFAAMLIASRLCSPRTNPLPNRVPTRPEHGPLGTIPAASPKQEAHG
jgi:DNA-binding response OmpR family regulator